jgi:hypothetical protein
LDHERDPEAGGRAQRRLAHRLPHAHQIFEVATHLLPRARGARRAQDDAHAIRHLEVLRDGLEALGGGGEHLVQHHGQVGEGAVDFLRLVHRPRLVALGHALPRRAAFHDDVFAPGQTDLETYAKPLADGVMLVRLLHDRAQADDGGIQRGERLGAFANPFFGGGAAPDVQEDHVDWQHEHSLSDGPAADMHVERHVGRRLQAYPKSCQPCAPSAIACA